MVIALSVINILSVWRCDNNIVTAGNVISEGSIFTDNYAAANAEVRCEYTSNQ